MTWLLVIFLLSDDGRIVPEAYPYENSQQCLANMPAAREYFGDKFIAARCVSETI